MISETLWLKNEKSKKWQFYIKNLGEKFNAQNPELEKVPTKKEHKEYANKSKLMANNFEKQKNKIIIEKPILSDAEVKKIMQDFDNH